MYEALGLCEEGQGGRLIDEAEWITNKAGKLGRGSASITSMIRTYYGQTLYKRPPLVNWPMNWSWPFVRRIRHSKVDTCVVSWDCFGAAGDVGHFSLSSINMPANISSVLITFSQFRLLSSNPYVDWSFIYISKRTYFFSQVVSCVDSTESGSWIHLEAWNLKVLQTVD